MTRAVAKIMFWGREQVDIMEPGSSEDYVSTTQNIWTCASCSDAEAPYLFLFRTPQSAPRNTTYHRMGMEAF